MESVRGSQSASHQSIRHSYSSLVGVSVIVFRPRPMHVRVDHRSTCLRSTSGLRLKGYSTVNVMYMPSAKCTRPDEPPIIRALSVPPPIGMLSLPAAVSPAYPHLVDDVAERDVGAWFECEGLRGRGLVRDVFDPADPVCFGDLVLVHAAVRLHRHRLHVVCSHDNELMSLAFSVVDRDGNEP